MIRKKLIIVALLAIAGPCYAQSTERTIRSLSLQEAISLALQHNFNIQISQFDPTVSQFSISIAYGAYDPVISASGQHNYSLSPGGLDAQNRPFTGSETESDSFASSLSGRLPTGMTYSLSGNVNHQYGSTPSTFLIPGQPFYSFQTVTDANGQNPQIIPVLQTPSTSIAGRRAFANTSVQVGALQLRQPLLKDFWIDGPRHDIQVAKNRLKYSEWALRFQIETIISSVERSYYELIFARENVKVQAKALELAERLLAENKKRVEVGALAPLDEKQAQSQVADARANLLIAQNNVALQENTLKDLISDDFRKWHALDVIPAENLVAVPTIFDLQESWKKGLVMRPDYVQARLDVQRGDINVKYSKNQLFPALDLIGQYGYTGQGNEYRQAFGNISDQANPFWAGGASLSYPLGNRAARYNYKSAKAQREQAQLLLKQKEQQIMVEIDNAMKQALSDFSRISATHEARVYAEDALKAEEKKLENGKSTNFQVLQLQRDLTQRRVDEIRALADYNNDLAQLAFREGNNLERHNLGLEIR